VKNPVEGVSLPGRAAASVSLNRISLLSSSSNWYRGFLSPTSRIRDQVLPVVNCVRIRGKRKVIPIRLADNPSFLKVIYSSGMPIAVHRSRSVPSRPRTTAGAMNRCHPRVPRGPWIPLPNPYLCRSSKLTPRWCTSRFIQGSGSANYRAALGRRARRSITIDERYCRGDWGAPKSDSSSATIGVPRSVIERIHRLKLLTVDVKAGRATRHYKLVKSDGPADLVFQSVKSGRHMRDNNILSRFIKPAAREIGIEFVNWRSLRTSYATWMVEAGANPKDVQGPDAALAHRDDDGHLCAVCS
jgi:hypothetical protein